MLCFVAVAVVLRISKSVIFCAKSVTCVQLCPIATCPFCLLPDKPSQTLNSNTNSPSKSSPAHAAQPIPTGSVR